MSEKKAAGQFKESESGLRDISFDEGVPAGSWKHRLHYVPLAVLLAGACAATGVGTWYKATHPAPQPAAAPAAQASSFARTTPQSLPEVCAPTPRADTPEQVSAWDRYMSGIETAASEHGATALFVPAPATWDIYSDKLPQWADPLMGTTSLDLMRSALSTHAWVDVREGLREAREGSEAPLYSAVNPHWSPYAAHVAWNQTLSCLAAVNPQLEGLPSLTPSGVSGVDAPNEYEALGAPAQSGPWAVPTYEQDPGSVHLLQLESRDELADTAARLAEVTGAPEVSLASPVDFQNKPALTSVVIVEFTQRYLALTPAAGK